MYVRWKVKPRANEYENGKRDKPVNLLIAYLVESRRVDGKPRQKTTYLASIKDNRLEYHKEYFWVDVDRAIDRLNLPDDQRLKIEQKISEKVPRPQVIEKPSVLTHELFQTREQYRPE